MGGEAYRALLASFAEVAQRQFATGVVEYPPAVSGDDGPAVMSGQEPFDYFGTESIFDRAGGPKEILWLDTSNHIDLYDAPRFIDMAATRCAGWFLDGLNQRPE